VVKKRYRRTMGSWGLLILLVCPPLAAPQLPTAEILGVVKDGSGAVVPGVTVTVRNVDTGQTRTTTTTENGSFRLVALPVGSYEVRTEHAGFQSQVRSGLLLTIGQEAVVNFSMEVGAVEQTVAVTAEAPIVNTTSGSLGGLVDQQRIADLPLNGRNYADLILLQPGVSQDKNVNFVGGMGGTWYSSNGAPVRSNNMLLDGAVLQNLYGTTSASVTGTTLGVEGIREYRVVTNSFSAEYGLTMGSQMVIVSKGGANDFHGSLFEYLRNSALDARNFFDRKTSITPRRLPAFTRNNFGASFGGPLKKDRTFFFAVFESVHERLGRTVVSNVIPAAAKLDGGLVFQIAPLIKPLLALYPNPNLPNNQYTFPFSQPSRTNYGQVRIDQTISSNATMFGRYTVDDGQQTQPLDYPQFLRDKANRSQYDTLSENQILSPTLLNTFRISFSRSNIRVDSPSGLSGPQYSLVAGQEIGTIGISGVTGLGPDGPPPTRHKQNVFTWSDDLFYTRGANSFKFGTLINRYQQYINNGTNVRGTLNFPSLPAFLQGQANLYSARTPGSISDRTYHYTTLGFYAQDDMKVLSNLTLNLGLRYEFMTQAEETQGRGSAIRDILHDATATLGIPLRNPSLKNVSPRFGFAWDVKGDGKTAVRGGFGLLYDLANLGSSFIVAVVGTPPFSSQSSVSNPPTLALPLFFPASSVGKSVRTLDYNLQQPHLLQYNLTLERQLPFNMAVTVAYAGSRGLNLTYTRDSNPTVPQILPDGRPFWLGTEPRLNPNWADAEVKTGGGNSWYHSFQLSITKRLSKGLQFQSSYTWSKAMDENQAQLTSDNNASSSFLVYSTKPSLDKAPAAFDATQNWRFNAIYRFHDSSSGRAGNALLSGWWMSGILSFQSGFPFTPALGSNRSRSKEGGGPSGLDRPDLATGRNAGNIGSGATAGCLGVAPGRKLGTPTLYFDPCAFAIPAAGFLGTAGRNILREPGLANLDLSLVKDTKLRFLGEGGKLEFRTEVFNILNRPNFSTPSRTVFSATQNAEVPLATAGVITNTATASRQIQIALKVLF